jgi:hypothetical protein
MLRVDSVNSDLRWRVDFGGARLVIRALDRELLTLSEHIGLGC